LKDEDRGHHRNERDEEVDQDQPEPLAAPPEIYLWAARKPRKNHNKIEMVIDFLRGFIPSSSIDRPSHRLAGGPAQPG
jgi:hypothetical protein